MKTIKQLEKQKIEIEKQLEKQKIEIEKQLEILKSKPIKIKELGIEVQSFLTHKSIKIRDLKIPKGWRLLTLQEGIYIYDNNLLNNFPNKNWELIQQFSKGNLNKGYKYSALDSDWLGDRLDVYGDCDDDSNGCAFGVRFCRDLKLKRSDKTDYGK